MKTTYLSLLFIFFYSICFTQPIQKHNCGQHILLRALLKSPEKLKLHIAEQKQLAKEEIENAQKSAKGIIYNVPIVFHLIHSGGVENIADAQILDALNTLNNDFRKLNADTSTIATLFQGIAADVEINFVLATIAPDGTCFSGITHTESPFSYVSNFSGGSDQLNAIINGNDVYQGEWSAHNYLNVIVCGNPSDGVAGYTNYPSNSFGNGMDNSIWMRHDYMGQIGTSNSNGRTLSHEVGHWLNLPHTWGSTNDPGLPSNCATDDGVLDTPNTIGATWCNLNDTACGPYANTENYMNYASCRKMFTAGQAARMRTALTSTIGGRNNLWQPANLIATGTQSAPALCQANFSSTNPIICAGDSVTFADLSFHNVVSRNWVFSGGSPGNSSLENPVVSYNNPGIYQVSLTVSDGVNSIAEIKNDYIVVLPSAGELIPYQEGFENTSAIGDSWFSNSSFWEVSTDAFSAGNQSMKLNNLLSADGVTHELESNTIDLSNETDITIGFKYAYANQYNGNSDKLQLLASKDCGETWFVRKSISNAQLANSSNTSAPFIPQPTDWQQVYVSNITPSYCISNFRFKFSFLSGGGNNLFIDDINIFPSSSLGINDRESTYSLFPNPSSNQLTIEGVEALKQLTVFDLYGRKIIAYNNINTASFSFGINTLASGWYIIKVFNGKTAKTLTFEKI